MYEDRPSLDFETRYRTLIEGSPRIAYYYAEPDTTTFRYRVLNMIEALGYAAPSASASWFTAADGASALDAVEQADILVICRALYSAHVGSVITKARAGGTRLVFDVDDLVFDPRVTHLVMETLDQDVNEASLTHWFGWTARLGEVLRLCDEAVTTNVFLADRIRAVHDIPVSVVPNFLNHAQLEISASILEEKRGAGFIGDGRIHLGYFSGTPTHNRDFALVEPAIVELLEEDPRVHLRVVGFLDLGRRLRRFADRVEMLPLENAVNLQRSIGEVELNLVPLQDNVFTNCKSELKYFEAAVVGTVTIASPTFTLRRAISHGETGFLARSHEWGDVLREAVERVHELEEVRERGAVTALASYTPIAQREVLKQAFGL